MMNKLLPHTLVCQPSSASDTDWISLYESAFPADERDKTEDVLEGIEDGDYLLHRTTDEDGTLLSFSLVEVVDGKFALLSYLATEEEHRCSGIGSQHLTRLIALLKEQYPDHCGLFLEIESSIDVDMESLGLNDQARSLRKRRKAFYQRLNFVLHQGRYLMPNLEEEYEDPLPGELLFLDYGRQAFDVTEVIKSIYADIYEIDENDLDALMSKLA